MLRASTCNTVALCIPNNYYKPRKCLLKSAKEEIKRADRQARKKRENDRGKEGKKVRRKAGVLGRENTLSHTSQVFNKLGLST